MYSIVVLHTMNALLQIKSLNVFLDCQTGEIKLNVVIINSSCGVGNNNATKQHSQQRHNKNNDDHTTKAE